MDQGDLYGKIYEVMTNQHFGILSTVENGIPRASIVAFTVTNNLRKILFLTKQESRKFQNIAGNPTVNIFVDVRPQTSQYISGSFGISATGIAKQIDLESAIATKELYLFCHPSLTEYFDDPSFALMSISVNKYDVTSGINEVSTYPMK